MDEVNWNVCPTSNFIPPPSRQHRPSTQKYKTTCHGQNELDVLECNLWLTGMTLIPLFLSYRKAETEDCSSVQFTHKRAHTHKNYKSISDFLLSRSVWHGIISLKSCKTTRSAHVVHSAVCYNNSSSLSRDSLWRNGFKITNTTWTIILHMGFSQDT